MTQVIGTFRLGEDASIALDAVSGDVSIVTSAIASMRQLRNGQPTGPTHTLNIAPRQASGQFPAGWNITVPNTMTAILRIGLYAIDVRLSGTGFVEITDASAVIEFTQPVS